MSSVPDLICPHCDRELKRASSREKHEKVCANRPSVDDLKAYLMDGYGIKAMGKELGVSQSICRTWLKEAGLWENDRKTVYNKVDKDLRIVIPGFRRLAKPPTGDGKLSSCARCRARNVCKESRKFSLLPCELPDMGQQVYLTGLGIDLLAVWVEMERRINLTDL